MDVELGFKVSVCAAEGGKSGLDRVFREEDLIENVA